MKFSWRLAKHHGHVFFKVSKGMGAHTSHHTNFSFLQKTNKIILIGFLCVIDYFKHLIKKIIARSFFYLFFMGDLYNKTGVVVQVGQRNANTFNKTSVY